MNDVVGESFADTARRFEYRVRHAQFFVHVTSLINPVTHRDIVHISDFISVTVEFYSGVDLTAANPIETLIRRRNAGYRVDACL